MKFGKSILTLLGVTLIVLAVGAGVVWTQFRFYVKDDECVVLTRKSGKELPSGQSVATEPGQKGIQEHVLGPGRYFYNPYTWEWKHVPLTVIPAGDPKTWKWIKSPRDGRTTSPRAGDFSFSGDPPKIGVVNRKVGAPSRDGSVFVSRASGEKGIWREVLTPGTYRLNPEVYAVELHPATVIPAGFVGVVTNLFGDDPADAAGAPPSGDGAPSPSQDITTAVERRLAEPHERGTMRNVLQPGVYFINPKLQKVILVEVGFNEYSQVKLSESENYRIAFSSETGFLIRVGVTVIWGIHPSHAAQIINEFGNVDGVLDKIIAPQLRSICRNIGATYAARDFIQGERREEFQKEMTEELRRVCGDKHVEVLLALVREVEVHAPDAAVGEVSEDIKKTIQQSFLAIESQLTKDKQREAAIVKAALEEERKKIDIAREMIQADTRLMVADIEADGEKEAARMRAQADLEAAALQSQVAELDAQRVQILGQAAADVERFKKEAEAEGFKMLVEAFGSPHAYNLYTFAQNFQPQAIRLFFAGEGTFWTDLDRLEDAAAAKVLQSSHAPDRP
ncbi:MAG: hypothetical protein BroJett003_19960 [Planctomycetota bacterium]|nr:MAG: hypothetical protein BroJett003_19960 [Planctomycetota bacterium]